MNVLCFAPHADDETLGCAGYLAKLARAGHSVYVVVMCDRSESHDYDPELVAHLEASCRRACKVLGVRGTYFAHLREERLDQGLRDVIVPMEKYIAWLRPSLVFLPHGGDVNQDHRALFEAGLVATRTLGNWEDKFEPGELPGRPNAYVQDDKISRRFNITEVLCYEVASTTEQAPPFAAWAFLPNVFVDITDTIELKVKALRCYKSEVGKFPFPRSEEGVRHLAAFRGMACSVRSAEAYMLKRSIVFQVDEAHVAGK